jgi:hypothetical protein
MAHDPLDLIAESYRGMHESTHIIAQATTRLAETQRRMEATQRGLVWLQGGVIGLLGAVLLFTGYVVWQHFTQAQAHAALTQALLTLLQRMPTP